MLKKPFLMEVVKEWALNVRAEEAPTAFANMFIIWMQDQRDEDLRKACGTFASYMKVRPWRVMFEALKPGLPEDNLSTFEMPHAEDFYEGFRSLVIEAIKDFYEQFMKNRLQTKGTNGSSEPQGEPVEAK